MVGFFKTETDHNPLMVGFKCNKVLELPEYDFYEM